MHQNVSPYLMENSQHLNKQLSDCTLIKQDGMWTQCAEPVPYLHIINI